MTQLIVLSCLALILSTAFVTAGAHGKPSGSPVYRRLTRACAPTPGQILQPAVIAAGKRDGKQSVQMKSG